ncbi:ABC transporter permease [Clostridium sp. LY3-2]|uniref:ABC transporter permease n=1 Tax=Clostridium sp. LY3-2 TaxID=2942482 RepID=UPI0021538956|nr:ABC transporter permease [Clostridium sp. LY3-2]MCR6514928.1 ABC transporter permease [Clostridium sp. LY3-2]
MCNILKAELYKLKYSKELKLTLLLIIIIGTITIYFHGNPTGRENLLDESTAIFSLISCAIFSGMFIGNEFSKRTIFHLIVSGHSRFSILISKFLSYLIGCLIIIIFNIIINGGIYTIFYGWGVPFDNSELTFTIIYILINILFSLCIASITFLVPIIIRDGTIATVISTFIMGLFLTLSQTFWLNTVLDISNGVKELQTVITAGIIMIIPIVIISLGKLLFETQDIK